MRKTGLVLEWLQKVDFHVNVGKSVFAVQEFEYPGYWLTRKGLQPQPKKVAATMIGSLNNQTSVMMIF
jgi:hypothetical protein